MTRPARPPDEQDEGYGESHAIAYETPWLACGHGRDDAMRRRGELEFFADEAGAAVRGGLRPASDRRTLVGLRPLEAAVLRSVWDRGRLVSIRDIHGDVLRRRPVAYATLVSTVAALRRKGLLRRERRGRSYAYAAEATDVEVASAILDVIATEVLGGDTRPLVEYIRALVGVDGRTVAS